MPVRAKGNCNSAAVKAIGWYIEEYGIAQISMNLTDIKTTPVHVAFDEVCRKAEARGVRVTGSEIVGLVPLNVLLDAGRYFLHKQKRSTGIPEKELLKIAIKSLGLNDLYAFDPQQKIIEYRMAGTPVKRLADMALKDFIDEVSTESAAPGGGSVSACLGALGAALGTMVANLSAHKKGWDERWEEFSGWAEKGRYYVDELTRLVDEDTQAFNSLMAAFSMPKNTVEEKQERAKAIQEATAQAIQVPLKVMETALDAMDICLTMAETGNPNSVSDAGVGVMALRTAVRGAFLNVRINLPGLENRKQAGQILEKAKITDIEAEKKERKVLELVQKKLD